MNTSNAKHCVACDECGASLGELYPNDHNNISVQLSDMGKHHAGDSETAYHNPEKSLSSKKTFHFCDESCMASNLNKRAKAKAKMSKMSKANVVDYQGNIEVDMTDYLKKKSLS
jgi:hypothetical protein